MTTATSTRLGIGPYNVEVAESGSGDAVVYFHGFEGQMHDAPFLEALSAGRRVVRPVHPGFAGSECPRELHNLHNVALLYDGVLAALDIEQADLVGHSLGAMFAAELAALRPTRVRKLALVAPMGIWFDEHPTPEVLSAGGSYLTRMLWADPEHPATTEGPGGIERTTNLATAANYLWPLPDRGLRERLYRLTMPVLLVRGEQDGLVSEGHLSAWQGLLPGSRLETIAGAGHYPMLEQPDAFVETLSSFFQ